MADVIVLPVIRIERYREDGSTELVQSGVHPGVGKQLLLPSSDRRNIVELGLVRLERTQAAMVETLRRANAAACRAAMVPPEDGA